MTASSIDRTASGVLGYARCVAFTASSRALTRSEEKKTEIRDAV